MFAAIAEVARDQHALVHHRQVIERGGTDSWLRNQCEAGRLERRAPCVYALTGAPITRVQALLVHVLAAGPVAYATGDSGLALWSPELRLPTIHDIVVPRGRRYRASGVRVRQSRDLDLAIPGVRNSVPDSDFERYVSRDLVAAGLPKPRHHHVVRLPGEDPIELDFDFPPGLVNLELDGADHVTRARRARRDRKRDRLLQSIGYEVLRYTWDDYVEDGDAMIEEIASFLERAGIWCR